MELLNKIAKINKKQVNVYDYDIIEYEKEYKVYSYLDLFKEKCLRK